MTKDKLLPEVNIGLIGHVDHGKTTLTAALSGKWTDTHSEELKRGITIKLGYADAIIKKCSKCNKYVLEEKCSCGGKAEAIRKISFVDAPGHETLMAVMISGAAIMDYAMLLVAANEACPQPQTQEHLMALKIMGIKNIIIIQNKIDLVTKEQAKKNHDQIKAFIKRSLGIEVPIIPISAQKRANLDILIEAIQELFTTPKRDTSKDPEFIVARSFDINKPGTDYEKLIGGVIGGAITQGIFKTGQEIAIKPGLRIEKKTGIEWRPITTKIDSIVVGNTQVKEKGSGGSIAISTKLDPYITKSDSLVGNTAGLPGRLPETKENLELQTHLFNHVIGVKENIDIDPIKMQEPLMISIATATTLGIVTQIGDKIKLQLKRPVCVRSGSKAAISRQISNRWHLIGYGEVV